MTRSRITYAAHARALLALGVPLVGSHLAQAALHVSDTVMLGWYGVAPLAAVVLGSSTFFTLFVLGAGFAIAVMPMVANALGRGDEVQVRRDTRMGLWLSILYGAVVLPVLWWSRPILEAMGQEPEIAALAQDYLRIAGFGMIPALLVMVLKSYLSALEHAGFVLWGTLAGVALNVALNWALIFGNWGAPELGVRGAAIATLATQLLTVALLAAYAAAHRDLRRFTLFARFWRADWPAFAQVFRLGWPIGLTGLAEGGLFSASSIMMGWVGTVELAAHGIALQVASVAFMVHLGLSNAATVRAGRAAGSGNAEALRDGAIAAIALSFLVGLVMVTLFLTVPAQIVGLFLDATNPSAPDVLAFGIVLLATAALFQLFDAMQAMALGFLRGVQDTRIPMWIAAFSYWIVGVPVSYALAFPMGFGGPGLWLGLTAGLAVAAALLMTRFWWGRGLRTRPSLAIPQR
ncbi:MATE family efflux transporter [Ostreiculturibacter nitratireducens]|uniref:MATE family efflux transporter n=1 Tax=Ostreiculturibacter nitratireducens TaxID=3075226 RepID=UPI0031B5CB32